jgi:hypothetical protein
MTLPFNVNINQFKGLPYLRIDRAFRFTGGTNTTNYFTRSAIGTPTSTTKYTISTWVKRTTTGLAGYFMGATKASSPTTDYSFIGFDSTDALVFGNVVANTANISATSKMFFQDTSAWYHIIVAVDTSLATATDRIKLYVNGIQQAWQTYTTSTSAPSYFATATSNIQVGAAQRGVGFIVNDNINAEVMFIDGQQLTPSSFGTWDTVTGVWQPIRYNGTFGTNGFYLTFQDNSSTSALGTDFSGVGNNFTPGASVNLTPGNSLYMSVIDSPTLYSDGSITYNRGNYCVFNARSGTMMVTNNGITKGGLYATFGGTTYDAAVGTMPLVKGKWYWEVVQATAVSIYATVGIIPANNVSWGASYAFALTNAVGYCSDGKKYVGSATGATYGSTWNTIGLTIGVALDLDNGTITFYRNGVAQPTLTIAIPGSGSLGYLPCIGYQSAYASSLHANFGQFPFNYTPPTGFLAVNTFNILASSPESILNGANAMAATQYTGTGATQSISNATSNKAGAAFKPDLVWIKSTSSILSHKLTDSVRGVQQALSTDLTAAQSNDTTGLTSFDTSGFTIGADANYNTSAAAYIAYSWLAGNGSATNTDGTIGSTISVNKKYGFSIVKYVGTGANGTVGHGLGVAPGFIVIKRAIAAGGATSTGLVYHSSLANTQVMTMSSTAAVATNTAAWNSTSPTSTTFSLGTDANVNTAGDTYIAYCWAPVSGYSAIGSYVGTGGPLFIPTNFRPRFVLWKRTNSAANWFIADSNKQFFNYTSQTGLSDISPNLNTGAVNINGIYFLSNGFNTASAQAFNNGTNFIYMAFADTPFTYSRAF